MKPNYEYDFTFNGVFYNILSSKDLTVEVTRGDYGENVIIPETVNYKSRTLSVVKIAHNAFCDCTRIVKIVIPRTVLYIGKNIFKGCTNLLYIYNCSNCSLEEFDEFNTIYEHIEKTPNAKIWEHIIEIPNAKVCNDFLFTTSDEGFSLYAYLGNEKKLVLPKKYENSQYSISPYAFKHCTNIVSLYIPKGVHKIHGNNFMNCTSLSDLYIEDCEETLFLGHNDGEDFGRESAFTGINHEPLSLFNDCPLNNIYIGRNLSYDTEYSHIYKYSPFANKTTLQTVVISNYVTTIKGHAFYGCSNIKKILIPDSITSIEEFAFAECRNLEKINIPSKIISLKNSLFENCEKLENIDIPNNITSFEEGVFYGCSALTSITIPNGVTSIKEYTFANCHNLKSIIIPNTITKIEKFAFRNCYSLIGITIPKSVIDIALGSFDGCTSLKELRIDDSSEILSLGHHSDVEKKAYINGGNIDHYYNGLFHDCPLETLYLGRNLFYYQTRLWQETSLSDNSVRHYYVYSKPPFSNKETLTNITIGCFVTEIGGSLFERCGIETLIIPPNVQIIKDGAFEYCSIKDLHIDNGNDTLEIGCTVDGLVEVIYSLFSHGLENLYLGRNCISDAPLFRCNKDLKTITIGESVTSIPKYAFYLCNHLERIYIETTIPPIIESGNFTEGQFANVQLYIPLGTLQLYKEADGWKNFWEIIEYNYITQEKQLDKSLQQNKNLFKNFISYIIKKITNAQK